MATDRRFDWNVQVNARPNLVDVLEDAGIADAGRGLPPAPATSPRAPSAAGDIPGVLPDSGGLAPWWVPPAQLVPPTEESFGFNYRVIGHDPDGQPVIAATVSATFRFPATSPLFPTARPVTWTALSAVLTIPINDVATGNASVVELPVTTVSKGDVVECSVDITGNLARAAYGVLSTPGFQGNSRALLIVTTAFDALQTVSHEAETVRVGSRTHPGSQTNLPLLATSRPAATMNGGISRPIPRPSQSRSTSNTSCHCSCRARTIRTYTEKCVRTARRRPSGAAKP